MEKQATLNPGCDMERVIYFAFLVYLWRYICYLFARAVTIAQRIVFVLIRLELIVWSQKKVMELWHKSFSS